jgi:hypothetical protein
MKQNLPPGKPLKASWTITMTGLPCRQGDYWLAEDGVLHRLTNGKWVPLRIANPSKDFFPGDHLLDQLDD